MIIIIATTGMILAGLIYLLCVPVYFEIGYNIERKKLESFSFRFCPFSYRIKPETGGNKGSTKQSDQEEQKKKRKIQFSMNYLKLLRYELGTLGQVASDTVKLIQGVVISPDYYLNVRLTGGFIEPHITGWVYGGVCAIQPMLGKSIRLLYAPDFTEESLNGKVRGRLAIRPYKIMREVLIFLWRLPKLRLLRIYFKSRKGGLYGKRTD